MLENRKISVIMTVYNTEFGFVKRAIDSVLMQDYQNFELIVVDDGSDKNLSISVLNYCIKYQNNITYLRHKNCSQSFSINKAIKLSSGNFITIIDSDDEYNANHLQNCINQIKDFDLIASKTITIVDNESQYYVSDRFDLSKNIHVDECILFATLFGKRIVFENYEFINIYGADADFFDKAAAKYVVKKCDFRSYIYYRNNANSISAKIKSLQLILN